MSSPTPDWQRAMLATIFTVHQQTPARFALTSWFDFLTSKYVMFNSCPSSREDILAFMTGQDEIEAMARQVGLSCHCYLGQHFLLLLLLILLLMLLLLTTTTSAPMPSSCPPGSGPCQGVSRCPQTWGETIHNVWWWLLYCSQLSSRISLRVI